jgi:hypothetical protein
VENVISLCKAASLTTDARELKKYKLDLVGVQEIRVALIHQVTVELGIRIMN